MPIGTNSAHAESTVTWPMMFISSVVALRHLLLRPQSLSSWRRGDDRLTAKSLRGQHLIRYILDTGVRFPVLKLCEISWGINFLTIKVWPIRNVKLIVIVYSWPPSTEFDSVLGIENNFPSPQEFKHWWFLMTLRSKNQKFELMLTRRAKAYNSSGSVV